MRVAATLIEYQVRKKFAGSDLSLMVERFDTMMSAENFANELNREKEHDENIYILETARRFYEL